MDSASPPDALIGIDPSTKQPPTTRIPSGTVARGLAQRVILDDETRNRCRALVGGLLDGNPPYDTNARHKANRRWEANVNFMEGQGMMDSSSVPYYAIFTGTEYYADCRTAYQPENPAHEHWNRAVTCRFHELLKRWPQFDREIKQASYWMRRHGIGPIFFDNLADWRFRAMRTGAVLVPKGAPSCMDKRMPYVVVRTSYTVVELWDRIKNAEGEEEYSASGWNKSAVRDALLASAKGLGETATWKNSWEGMQQQLKNNDLGTSSECADIACAHVLVQEFDGKVSHFIVTETAGVASDNPTHPVKKNDGFLFRAVNRYDSYAQAVIPFFIDAGDGTWHSVRGMLDKAFRHLELSNRFKCRAIDGAFIRASLILKATNKEGQKAMQLTNFGPTTVLGPNAEVQQMQVGTDIEAIMLVDRTMANNLANNLSVFQGRAMSREDGRGEVPTATQVNQQVLKESSLNQAQISEFYFPLDQVVAEVFRRAVESGDSEAKRFRDECEEDGVPKEALKKMEYVRFNRTSGYGSPQMRLLTDQQMRIVLPMMNEEGRQNWLNDYIGGVKGADKVARYNPKTEVPGMDDAMAAQENGLIRQGLTPIHYSGEQHVSHLKLHAQDAEEYLGPLEQALENGEGDAAALEDAYGYTLRMGEHFQGHLGALQGDPTQRELSEYFRDRLAFITSFSGKLRSAVIRAQRQAELAAEEQQQAGALGALDAAKLESARTDMEIKQAKAANDINLKNAKTSNTIRTGNIKTVEQIRQQRALEQSKLRNANSRE